MVAAAVLALAAVVAGATAALAGPPAPDRRFIDRSVLGTMRAQHIPGILVAVSSPGGNYQHAYGVSNLGNRAPMRTNLHVRIAGIVRTFIATALLEQVERGRIATSDMAAHGIRGASGGKPTTVGQLLARPPSVELLTKMLRRASGQPVFSVVTRQVINRTHLRATSFRDEMPRPYAHGYCPSRGRNGGLRDCTTVSLSTASLTSTLHDVEQWGKTFATGSLLAARLRPLLSPEIVRVGDWLGAAGTGAGFSVATFYEPSTGSSIAIVANRSSASLRALVTALARHASAPAAYGPPPQVSALPRTGDPASVSRGTWAGTPPMQFAYRWERCSSAGSSCTDIAGATNDHYVPGPQDIGSTLRAVVTASNGTLAGGGSASVSSGPSALVQAIPPSNTASPQVSGTDRDGHVVTVSDGSWSGSSPISYTYQWQRCGLSDGSCADVSGATSAQYVVGPTDINSRLRAAVTATNAGSSSTALSAPTDVIGAARDPVVVAVGDIACPDNDTTNPCVQAKTAALAQTQHPDDVLVLGDNQYNTGSLAEFNGQHAYNATWGVFNSIVHPVTGNHEYETRNAQGYFDYFGSAAGPASGTYSFDLGTWHLVALNSNCAEHKTPSCGDYAAGATTASQNGWLQSDLASNSSACTLAFWHHPLFSDGFVGSSPGVSNLWTQLYGAHADVVLNGHDHLYERYAQLDPAGDQTATGIRELVAGTGGEIMDDPPVASDPNLERSDPSDFGVLVMTLHPTSYDWKYLSIGPNGTSTPTVIDRGTTSCHGPAADSQSARAARDFAGADLARLSAPQLSFDAKPLPRSRSAVASTGLPVAIHCSRACDVAVTAWRRRGGRLRRIAHFWETESNIPYRHSRIVLRLPPRTLHGPAPVTVVLRFAAVDAANHHRVLTRTVRLPGR